MLVQDDRLAAVAAATDVVRSRHTSLDGLTRLAADALDVDFGFVSLVSADDELLTAVARPELGALPASLPVEASICQFLVTSGLPLLVPDLHVHPVLSNLAEVRALGLRSYAGTPITTADGLVLGGFCVGHRSPRAWTARDATLLRGLADAAAVELRLLVALAELERVRAGERERAEQQAALHRVAVAVARGERPETVLQLVAEELARLLVVSTALVLRFHPDGRAHVAACAGTSNDGEASLASCATAVARVRGTGEAAVGGQRDGENACAAVPVVIHGRTWGAVVAVTADGAQDATLCQLERLADFISLVVVNTEAQGLLVELARTDPLTGAANRRAFDEQVAGELERARRHGHPVTLALLDIDHFKVVNDRHGHDTGDRVLRELTGRVGQQLRSADLLARLGGDEFALLLPEAGHEEAATAVERVRAQVALLPLGGVAVTVTVGAAVVPDGHCTPQALFRAADRALYDAKARGRDTVHVGPLD